MDTLEVRLDEVERYGMGCGLVLAALREQLGCTSEGTVSKIALARRLRTPVWTLHRRLEKLQQHGMLTKLAGDAVHPSQPRVYHLHQLTDPASNDSKNRGQ